MTGLFFSLFTNTHYRYLKLMGGKDVQAKFTRMGNRSKGEQSTTQYVIC